MSFKDLVTQSFLGLDEFKQEIAKLTAIQLNRGVLVESRGSGSPIVDERAIDSSNDVNTRDLDQKEGVHLYNSIHKLSNNLYHMNAELALQLYRDEFSGNKKTLLSGGHFWSIMSSVSHYLQLSKIRPKPERLWDQDLMPNLKTDTQETDFFAIFTDAYNKESSRILSDRKVCAAFTESMHETFKSLHSSRLLIDSSTLVHCLLKSDPFLERIQVLLKGLTTIERIENFELNAKISRLRKLIDDHKVDLNKLLESNQNPEVVREFYEILYLKLRSSNSVEIVCDFLGNFNLTSLVNITRGGSPYFQSEVLKEIGSVEHKALVLPDFMRSAQSQDIDHSGNPNWLVWLTKVGEFARKCPDPAMRKFFAALVSDYSIVSEHSTSPIDKLWNTLRVANPTYLVIPQPRGHQAVCLAAQNNR